jgi:hypothetical protein
VVIPWSAVDLTTVSGRTAHLHRYACAAYGQRIYPLIPFFHTRSYPRCVFGEARAELEATDQSVLEDRVSDPPSVKSSSRHDDT